MQRHEFDVVSLVAGLLFVIVAGTYAIVQAADASFDAQWVLPSLFVGLGLVIGAIALRRVLPPSTPRE